MSEIDLEEGKDCFGRIMTEEAINKRHDNRMALCGSLLILAYLALGITFMLIMTKELPINKPVSELFIVSCIIVCLCWGPPILFIIGGAFYWMIMLL